MRQTGRTSRIIDFTIDQLFSVGEVIVTDHIAFEFENVTNKSLFYFIDRVKDRFEFNSRHINGWKLDANIIDVNVDSINGRIKRKILY